MKQFMPHATPNERLRVLRESAASIEQTTYRKPLTEDELATHREVFTENCIKLNQFEDELNAQKELYKAKMDPVKNVNKNILSEIKTKQTSVTGELFNVPNFDDNMMESFDGAGELIGSRRLRPEEKQANIYSISSKTA
jgi:hypothetical protein